MSNQEPATLVDLLARARGRDADCLNQLFAECRNYLYLTARAQLGGPLQAKMDASDLVQQTLLDAYRAFPDFHGTSDGEWLAWLRRILVNNLANAVRHYRGTAKRQLQKEVPLADAGSSSFRQDAMVAVENSETPSRYLMRKERELLLADAVAQLPPDYQEVILLRNLQRLPFQEVAERMGRSRPAVQMLWMRALEKLKELLAEMSLSLPA